jgi:hypothetical protein
LLICFIIRVHPFRLVLIRIPQNVLFAQTDLGI